MTRKGWVLLVVVLLSIGTYMAVQHVAQAARQANETRQVQDLRTEAAAFVKEGKLAQAADKLEALQVLFMNGGRCQDALEASLAIEDLSQKFAECRSPWNYVRIAEAYLGMGDTGKYFDWMEKAVGERSISKLDYFQGTRLNGVRNQPRFKKLVAACATLIGVGQEAKDFQVELLDGSSFTLSAHRGRVVLIDFWDVRCGACRKEMLCLWWRWGGGCLASCNGPSVDSLAPRESTGHEHGDPHAPGPTSVPS